jgi:hypothetical protein
MKRQHLRSQKVGPRPDWDNSRSFYCFSNFLTQRGRRCSATPASAVRKAADLAITCQTDRLPGNVRVLSFTQVEGSIWGPPAGL